MCQVCFPCTLVLASVVVAHMCISHVDMHQHLRTCCTLHFGLQQMWEDMGVTWEWTWYSQTVHAFTQPQLVGAAASAVSPFCCTVLCFATGSSAQSANDVHMSMLLYAAQQCAELDCKHHVSASTFSPGMHGFKSDSASASAVSSNRHNRLVLPVHCIGKSAALCFLCRAS